MRDHYEVLGVNRNASDKEIKQAYRKLAAKFHPDRNKDPGAGDKLAEINAAYDVIGNPEKREMYDAGGAHGGGHSFRWTNMGGANPEDFMQREMDDILNAFIRRHQQQQRQTYSLTISLEQAYVGCTVQAGNETIQIPKGVRSGNILHLADKNIRLNVTAHRKFKRSNDDLLIDVTIDAFEAMNGIKLNLNHLSGKKYSVKIPPGTQPGQIIKMAGKGMPNPEHDFYGDLLIRCNVVVPTHLTDEEKAFIVSRTRDSFDA